MVLRGLMFVTESKKPALKILIIEDETVIRNGLLKHISWESLGVDEIKVAENAEKAYIGQILKVLSSDKFYNTRGKDEQYIEFYTLNKAFNSLER